MVKATIVTPLVLLLCLTAAQVFGQSNEMLDDVLDQESLSLGAGAYLVLSATSVLGGETDFEAASRTLDEQPWWKPGKGPADSVSLGEYSYMVMKAFDLRGGIMYSILGGKRYAARELAFLGFLETDTSPYRTLSGEEAVRILSRILDWREVAP